MAAYQKIDIFVVDLAEKVHDTNADLIKVALTNTTPLVTNTVFANITEIGAGNGYTAGGDDTTNTHAGASGTLTVSAVDVVFTASGGTIGPFQYVVLYNDTPASPLDPLIAWWDHGSAVTLADAETFTVDFAADTLFTLA